MLVEILLCILICLGVLTLLGSKKNSSKFPPGPLGLPFVGYLPFLGKQPQTRYGLIAKKYGNVFSLTLGSFPIVILNDLESIRKAFRQDVFTGRPKSILAMSITSDGISFNDGSAWMQQRKFTLKTLHELGFGRTSLESSIREEVQRLVQHLRTQSGKPICLKHILEISVINTLWSIVASKKYSLDDPEAIHMHKICYEGFIEPEVAGVVWFMPWLAKLAPDWTGLTALNLAVKNMRELFEDLIRKRKKSYSPGTLRNFVDIYLKEIQSTNDPNSSFYKHVGLNNLVHVLIDLFTAGSDTTSSTLSWAILYLLHYPHVLAKLQAEIYNVVGTDELPTTLDRGRMPYTEATLSEVFRMSSIVSGALLHSTLSSTTFEGYHLPKDTIVMANLWQVHHEAGHWENPFEFRPERFLDADGNYRKNDALVPFCTGKRICPAENLATTNFFLYLTGLVQNFEFEVDKNYPLPSLDAKPGLVLSPQTYHVVLRPRENSAVNSILDFRQ